MIQSLISGSGNVFYYLLTIPIVLISLTFHEYSHGYAALKCGDPTARNLGRLSLNPIVHLDPIGALMMLFLGFGWAKPVPINSRNFSKPRRDVAIVSFAGPLMNFALALLGTFLFVIAFSGFWSAKKAGIPLYDALGKEYQLILYNVEGICNALEFSKFQISTLTFLQLFVFLNVGLGTFNLIPFPPLDGSNILMCLLPPKYAMKFSQIGKYSRYFFLALILSTWLPFNLSGIVFMPIEFARNGIIKLFYNLVTLIPFFR